jgi:tetratricopeptide (TPR) repeat protein
MSNSPAISSALQALPEAIQTSLAKLSVLKEGGNLVVISHVARSESVDAAKIMMDEVVSAGLAEEKDHTYYHFNPELLAHLKQISSPEQQQVSHQHWLAAMDQLLGFLYQQHFEEGPMAERLSTLERANLMAYLSELSAAPNLVADNANGVLELLRRMDTLLEKQECPNEQAQIQQWMANAEALLGDWGPLRFDQERQNVEGLIAQNSLLPASRAAQALLQHCHEVGAEAYEGADKDLAFANILMARVLKLGGSGEEALNYLQQAQGILESKVSSDKTAASYMVASLMEQGECLFAQRQLVPAEVVYSKAIELAESTEDLRGSGIAQTQRAAVYSMLKRPADALRGYQSALEVFQQMDDGVLEVNVWHQIAMLHRVNEDYDSAATALTSALKLLTSQKNTVGVLSTLVELGSLSEQSESLPAAVNYYLQAIKFAEESGDQYRQAAAVNRLADVYRKQGEIKLALEALELAGSLGQQFGHAAEPWKTWSILSKLHTDNNNPEGAEKARQQAIETYVSYRVDGGQNNEGDGQLCAMVLQAIQTDNDFDIRKLLAQLADNEAWKAEDHQGLIQILTQFLDGKRGLSLLDNAALNYRHVAELVLLQDRLPA